MKKILIIDDDLIVSHIYQNNFVLEGFEVECAHDGEAGLASVASFRPDLVLLDLALPTLSGIQILTRLRQDPATQALPVVVLTNCYQPKMVEQAWKIGATKCLRKSDCTPRVVTERVLKILETSKTQPPTLEPVGPAAPAPVILSKPVSLEELRSSFFGQARESIGNFRRLLQALTKEQDMAGRVALLTQLHRAVPSLTGSAAVCGYRQIAQLASALEALAQELRDRPKYLGPSTTRTLAQCIDFLGESISSWISAPDEAPDLPPNILVVDDDITCREMVVFALTKAGLNCVSLGSPKVAMEVLESNRFDLVFLDINMPEVDGFEICKKIRQQPQNAGCPVVFVTGASDFTNRARSTISGGTDLIAKPFLLVELAAKSLIHLFGSELGHTPSKAVAQAA